MTHKKFLKNFLTTGGLSAALAPIAIAASCGSDSSTTSATNKPGSITFISQIKADATSLSDNVKWPAVKIDTSIASIQYFYSDVTQMLDAVKKLDAKLWTNALPVVINVEPASRFLWVKLTLVAGNELKDNIIDITASSQIGLIKGNLDTLSEYKNFNAGGEIITNTLSPYLLTEATNVPSLAKIVYEITSNEAASLSELRAFLDTKPVGEALNTIKAYLKPIDESKYALTPKKVAMTIKMAEADTALVNEIQVNPSSTHESLALLATASDPSITKVQYYYSSTYKTVEAVSALPDTSWTDNLPSAVDFEPTSRHLWVKLTPLSGFALKTNVFDITTSSQITLVKGKVDLLPGFASYTIKVQVNITSSNYYEVEVVSGNFPKTVIAFNWSGKSGATLSELQEFVAERPSAEVLSGIRAYLKPVDANKYFVLDNKTEPLIINRLTAPAITLSEAEKAELAKIAVTDETSGGIPTHNAVKWKPLPTLPASIANITYLSGNYANEDEAKNAPKDAWSSALPTSVDYRPSKRHLWARVAAPIGKRFANPYVDLTTSSNLMSVAVFIDLIDEINFSKIDFSKMVITGTWSSMHLSAPSEAGFELPPYLYIIVRWGNLYSNTRHSSSNGGGLNFQQFQSHINAEQLVITEENLKSIVFSFNIDYPKLDPDLTFRANTLLTDKSVSPKFEIKTLEAQKLMQYYKASGTAGAITWNNLPLPYGFESVKFISGNYETKKEAIASGIESSTIPTTLDANPAQRHRWVKVTPKVGFTTNDGENYIDITESSGIKNIA